MELITKQKEIIKKLIAKFGVSKDDIYFLNPEKPEEPWLTANALIALARQSPDLRSVNEDYVSYIAPLNQVVHRAVVIDAQGRDFARSGIATLGEKPGMDEHIIASGRAVSAALTAAGFNPLKAGNVVAGNERAVVGEIEQRRKDLGRIKLVARECGYITEAGLGEDYTHYRAALQRTFGVNTAAKLDASQRASFIQFMLTHQPQIEAAPEEFAEMEVAA
jgi:hypothetical protein